MSAPGDQEGLAANTAAVNFDSIIKNHKQRWRIETACRVPGGSRIRSKSKEPRVRDFSHAYAQAMPFTWVALFNEDAPLKRFLLQLYETSKTRVMREPGKQARRTDPSA